MPDFLDLDLYYGLVVGGAIVWLFKKAIQKWKGKVEVKLDDLSDSVKANLKL